MNIIVDLNYPIKDGTEVVFRSPVDCSQVTGLLVNYYDNGPCSKEFAFADANGNNVGDIDHLFGEDVPVKVILDVTKKSMAFVQNADTNAYLEGRFAALEAMIGKDIQSIDGWDLVTLAENRKLVIGTYYLITSDVYSQYTLDATAGTLFLAEGSQELVEVARFAIPETSITPKSGVELDSDACNLLLNPGAYYLATSDCSGAGVTVTAGTLYRATSTTELEKVIDLAGGGSADLGDIETALDSIIAIQNSLIGGDGV